MPEHYSAIIDGKRLVEQHADQRTWFKCFGEPEEA
jgi:hypothetical protein